VGTEKSHGALRAMQLPPPGNADAIDRLHRVDWSGLNGAREDVPSPALCSDRLLRLYTTTVCGRYDAVVWALIAERIRSACLDHPILGAFVQVVVFGSWDFFEIKYNIP